ncbi:hypothetical protein [Trujillonella endophytica]|uniref:4-amino-4-deoxy-L-arabinose transferase n=1 Tax=Trujillonella endophytica TaxID=673521 RepID=A0A1H8VIT7_9ACTN|nr:hypothetical protein [Trujillella endophytica]SEP15214.1 hypothetical protein SAMN05660991_03577 [Trujillella endophytica]
MTAVAALPATARSRAARLLATYAPVPAAAAAAAAMGLFDTPVGDLQAAIAREQAAESGVGVTYWFSWYGGLSPGSYSSLVPALSRGIGSFGLLVLATLAVTALGGPLARDTARPALLRWCICAAAVSNMFAGRVAFGVAAAVALAAVLALTRGRVVLGGLLMAVSGLASPLAPAFAGLVTVPLLLAGGHRSPPVRSLLLGAGAGVALPVVLFGTGGSQPFGGVTFVWGILAGLAAYPALRTTEQRWLLPLVAPVTVVLAVVPNGVGSNLGRFFSLVLPCVLIVWSRWGGVRLLAALLPALVWLVQNPVHDQLVAVEGGYAAEDYTSLRDALLARGDLEGHRVELLDSSSHVGSHELGSSVWLARGWENQTESRYHDSLFDEEMPSAADYRRWLADNAVAYIAVAADPLTNFRTRAVLGLIDADLPYLTRVWADERWTLYRVEDPAPIVPPPLTLVEAAPSRMVVDVPDTAEHHLQIRPNRYLVARSEADPGVTACFTPTPDDWVTLRAPVPGRYVLEGEFSLDAALGGAPDEC